MAVKRIAWILAAMLMLACALFAWNALMPLREFKEKPVGTQVLAADGTVLATFGGTSQYITYQDLPAHLIVAVLAAEDERFFVHPGIDVRALLRALTQTIGGNRQGGSTLTQQLIKITAYPDAPRSSMQKLKEMIGALALELHLEKEEIFERYINAVYFGAGAQGVGEAASVYFGKAPSELTLGEAAALAVAINQPSRINPQENKELLTQKRNRLIEKMAQEGWIAQENAQAAISEPLTLVQSPKKQKLAFHAAQMALQEAKRLVPNQTNLIIKTTISTAMQAEAESQLRQALIPLVASHATNAATVVMDTQTGRILALVGSADPDAQGIQGQVNMATAKRQPGSALKPFLYFQYFMEGLGTPDTVILDEPVRYEEEEGSYYPRNFSHQYYGDVPLKVALASSLNVPAVKLVDEIGVASFMEALKRFGINFPASPQHYGRALVLGGGEVSLLNLTAAYAALAKEAKEVTPVLIAEIEKDGKVVWRQEEQKQGDLFPYNQEQARNAARAITQILSNKANRIKAFGENRLMDTGKNIPVKTGTTQDYKDNWAFGYTPQYTVGVWVGNTDGSSMEGVSGISGAIPLWNALITPLTKAPITWPAPSFAPAVNINSQKRIITPVNKDIYEINPSRPPTAQRIPFVAGGFNDEPVEWILNGVPLPDNTSTVWWEPQKGTHTLQIKDLPGTITFTVR